MQDSSTLHVLTPADYAPFSSKKPDGSFEGSDIDLAKQFAQFLKIKIKFYKTDWPSLHQKFSSGQYDLAVGGIAKTPEREKLFLCSHGYYEDWKTPIVKVERLKEFQKWEDIDREGIRLLVNPGGSNDFFFQSEIKNAFAVYHENISTIFEALMAGKADVMITDFTEAQLQIKKYSELCLPLPKLKLMPHHYVWLIQQKFKYKSKLNSFLKVRLLQ